MAQNVVISGGSKGIGKAIAKAFVMQDCNTLIAARNADDLQAAAAELQSLNKNVKIYFKSTDFSDRRSVEALHVFIKEKFESIDVLVNNVGSYKGDTINEYNPELAMEMLQVNLMGAYHLTMPLVEKFRSAKKGHIFNILSVAALELRKEAVTYSISKLAFKGFHQALLNDLRMFKVKVTGVYPGATITESWGEMDGSAFVKPEEIAAAIINAWQMPASTNIDEIIIRPIVPVD